MDVSDVEVLFAEAKMLTRMDHRPDFDDVLAWVDKVWDEPLLLRGSFDDVEGRRQTTEARAFATRAARSTSPSATPWEMTAVAFTTVLCPGWKQVVEGFEG